MTFETDDVMRIDDVVFWGGEGDEGFFIAPDAFEGWEDTPEVRYEKFDRSGGDGEFDAKTEYEARILVVGGKCLAASAEELGWYRNRLVSLVQGQKLVAVKYQGVESYAFGRQAAAVKFRTVLPGREARFQLSLRFHNPRRFGASREFRSGDDGRWAAMHRGNYGAESFIEVYGDAPGYTIGGPESREYKVREPVRPGVPHRIELNSGQISVGGEVRFGIALRADTWSIASGIKSNHRITPDAPGYVNAVHTVKDTWI